MLPQNNQPDNIRRVSNTRALITAETRIILPPGTVFKVLPSDRDNKIWLATERVPQRVFTADLSNPLWIIIAGGRVQK